MIIFVGLLIVSWLWDIFMRLVGILVIEWI